MRISRSCIEDFVPLGNRSVEQLANDLSLSTAEVEGVHHIAQFLDDARIAEVLDRRPIGDGRLSVVDVAVGFGRKETTICGAGNVEKGMKCVFLPVGSRLDSESIITEKSFEGVTSRGMLCSEAELGLGPDAGGIWSLPATAPVGGLLSDFLGISSDSIIEIDNKSLTHRPDLWGHAGFAREFSTILRTRMKGLYDKSWEREVEARFHPEEKSPIVPQVDTDSSCLGFYAISVEGVKVEKSPPWMQMRLRAFGLRPVNNLVDIGNYVMCELGLPMHMYDLDRIHGSNLLIKRVPAPCELPMLDNSVALLEKGDTVVADEKGPLVIAGVMGGAASGVSSETTRVCIEVANWLPAAVRKVSMRIGIRTDSSLRYEKSLDSHLLRQTALRAVDLVTRLCPTARVIGTLTYSGPDLSLSKPRIIPLSYGKIDSLLGHEVDHAEVCEIMDFLGFEAREEKGILSVTVPSWRNTKDVSCEADLVEEIGRIVTYNAISPRAPLNEVVAVRQPAATALQRKIQDFLVMNGRLLEIRTYPLIGRDLLEQAGWADLNDSLKLMNPWSSDLDRPRPSLVPSLLTAVELNQKNFDNFGCFEIGRAYVPDPQNFSMEHLCLAAGLFDRDRNRIVECVELAERLFRHLEIRGITLAPYNEESFDHSLFVSRAGIHPSQSQTVLLNGSCIGIITAIHPSILKNFKVRGNLSCIILNLKALIDNPAKMQKTYQTIGRLPTSSLDFTVVVSPGVSSEKMLQCMEQLKIPEILEVKLTASFDLPEPGKRAVTIHVVTGDPAKTLDSARIESLSAEIVKGLEACDFVLRS